MKQKSKFVGVKFLQGLKRKCEKGARIKYDCFELQPYLSSHSNSKIEYQRLLFSLRCEMNLLKPNFKRNKSMVSSFCIANCKQVLDNEHLVYCEKMNKDSGIRFENI